MELVQPLDDQRESVVTECLHRHAFVLAHPAVTSAIVGPRTLPQLHDVLAGADIRLANDVLDEIDAIVPPGTQLNPADAGWTPPALSDPAARRRNR